MTNRVNELQMAVDSVRDHGRQNHQFVQKVSNGVTSRQVTTRIAVHPAVHTVNLADRRVTMSPSHLAFSG